MRITLLIPVVTTIMTASAVAAATPAGSWPTFNHDFQRTGHADGVGSMTTAPKTAWTLPMGTVLGPQQAIVSDLTGDGRPETITVSAGRVVANKPDGSALWSSALLSATTVLGAWNLDSSGSPEVVADTSAGAVVLAGADGHILTTIPSTEPVQASFAPEGAGGILVLSSYNGPVAGYDFRNGTSVTTPSWTFTGSTDPSTLVGDVDGDGKPDLVRVLVAGFEIDDPLTGVAEYSLPSMGPSAYYYDYELVNIDGLPGLEIVAVDESYQYSPSCGIYVLGVKAGTLQTLWSATASPSVSLGASFFTVSGSVANLLAPDGGGPLQLVYSQWDGTSWTTTIADAASGATLGTISNGFLQAVADIDGDGKAEIVTRAGVIGNQSPPRSTVSAYDFDSQQTGPVAKTWTLTNAHVMTTAYVQPIGPGIQLPVLADFDPSVPGLEFLVGVDQSMANADTNLMIVHGSDGSSASKYTVPSSVTPTVVGVANSLTSASSSNDIVIDESDGAVHVVDSGLAQHASFAAGTYGNWLHAIANPANYANIFIATVNQHLQWIDGRHLHADGTPYVLFDESHILDTSASAAQGDPQDPVILLNGPTPRLVTFEHIGTSVSLVAHGLSGVSAWSVALDPGTFPYIPGGYAIDLNGDGTDDLVLSVYDINSAQSLLAYDGTNGTLLSSVLISSLGPSFNELLPGSLVDVNADGHPDLVAPDDGLYEVVAINLFAQPFAEIWPASQQPLVAVNGTVAASPAGDGGATALLRSNGNNGFGPFQRIALDGGVTASGDQGLPSVAGVDQNAAALVAGATPGVFDLVATGSADVGLSRVRRIAGDTMNTVWTQYAANGGVMPTAPSPAYSLHEPITFDVNGDGVDDIVFGSDDGYMYALSSTDGALLFSVNLGAPVVHVIAANIDLDPQLEILASLSDGRLIALDDSYTAMKDSPDGGLDASADGATDGGRDATTDAASEGGPVGGDAATSEAGMDGAADGGPGETSSGGGCSCAVAGGSSGLADALLPLLGLIGILGVWVRRAAKPRRR